MAISPARTAARREGRETGLSRMVKCSYCSVYVPEESALGAGESWYCSRDHRDAAVRSE